MAFASSAASTHGAAMRFRRFSFLAPLALITAAGCSSADSKPAGNPADAGGDTNDASSTPQNPFAVPCADSTADVYTTPTALAPYDPSKRGDIVRCGFDRTLSAADIDAANIAEGFKTKKSVTGVKMWRVAFRTERLGGKEGISSGWVFVPDVPIPGAQPLVVVAHGTRGAAPVCTQSKSNDLKDDEVMMSLSIAAAGYTVIGPDYAGADYGQPPPAYLLSEDEAHSMLDGTRALRKLLPGKLDDKVMIVGHSQGAHVVLSTQAYAKSYGMAGTLAGVIAFAPPWFTARSYGAILHPLGGLTTKNDAGTIGYATLYFWTHGEVYDGPGKGLDHIQPDKRDALKVLLTTKCSGELGDAMPSFGATPRDFFDPAFVDAVGLCAIANTDCDKEPAATWLKRFRADRPTIDVAGAPIVIWQGKNDTTIPPERVVCGMDKIKKDIADAGAAAKITLTVCGDKDADHGGVVQRNMDWVNTWIGARLRGEKDPSCAGREVLVTAKGDPIVCATPPENVD